jgi:hypothetical protein
VCLPQLVNLAPKNQVQFRDPCGKYFRVSLSIDDAAQLEHSLAVGGIHEGSSLACGSGELTQEFLVVVQFEISLYRVWPRSCIPVALSMLLSQSEQRLG